MFKNATLLRLVHSEPLDLATAEFNATAAHHTPIGETQDKSIGWVPPREQGAPMIEVIAGNWILAALVETRTVPPSAVDKRVDELAAKIEQETGRKPGRKQRRELKDAAVLELLPRAFPKAVKVLVWIDPAANLVLMDTASVSVADDVTSLLVQSLNLGMLQPLNTKMAPAAIMTGWLHDGSPAIDEFTLGDACELRATDDTQATVIYKNTALDCDEVKNHVNTGKVATSLSLCWQGRAWLTLTDSLVLKGLEVMGDAKSTGVPDTSTVFDADAAIFTGEMQPLLSDLIAAMDGLAEDPAEEGAEA